MRTCQVAVIGLGIMGSAALHALVRAGVDALGFDPRPAGGREGSSHGSCRIYRRFNSESEGYTALSDRAFAAWMDLEREAGVQLLLPSPVLEAGPPGSEMVERSRAAAARIDALKGPTRGSEINAAYPAFRLPENWDVVLHDAGGILLADAALGYLRSALADRIVPQIAHIAPRSTGIEILTEDGSRLEATQAVVIATGPWIGELTPGLARHVSVTRQVVGWFEPAHPRAVAHGEFPIFILDGPHGDIYGFPDFEGRGVKAACHNLGPTVASMAWGPAPTDAELTPVADTLKALIPGASGTIVDRDVCLYTNTHVGDVDGSREKEFVIDRLPEDPRIIVASPCSGHGFKFASAIGRDLAEMAVDEGRRADPAFRLSRFSAFAPPSMGA